MKFLYPQFLYALFTLAIPIIIHLFNFKKYKNYYYSDISFLKSLKEKTKSQSQLRHLLIFLCRALTFIFIVFAFAQPYIPIQSQQVIVKKHAVSVFIDNSFSMNSVNKQGNLLDAAKQKATEVLNAYSESDDFHFLDNNFNGVSNRLFTKEDSKKEINQIISSSTHRELELIIKKQIDGLKSSDAIKKDLYIISDFNNYKNDISNLTLDSNISINLIKIESDNKNNLFIDSCWFNSPILHLNKELTLNVRIKNNGGEYLKNQSIKLFVDNQQIAISNYDINDETIVPINFIANKDGWNTGLLKIEDFPITFDNSFFISFLIKQKINVSSIYQSNESKSLKNLFNGDDFFKYSSYRKNQIRYNELKNHDLIILDELNDLTSGLIQFLNSFLKNGGSLLVFPSEDMDYSSFQKLSENLDIDQYGKYNSGQEITSVNFEHPVFNGVFEKKTTKLNLPNVKGFFEIGNSKSSINAIMNYSDKKPVIKQFTLEKGKVYLSSIGLNKSFSNLSKHALFVPLIYNISALSSSNQVLSHELGKKKVENTENIPLRNTTINNEDFQFIPEIQNQQIWIYDQIKNAGIYELKNNDSLFAKLAFNYDRKESVFKSFDFKSINKGLNKNAFNVFDNQNENLTAKIENIKDGFSLWTICIIITIFLLATETLLLKLL
jgi:hypothetical protein